MNNNVCDSCDKTEEESIGGLFDYSCKVCRVVYTLCSSCASAAFKEQKCIECLNDGK